MRIIFAFCIILLFSGCALVQAPQKIRFDSTEYYIVTQIRTNAQEQLKKCPDVNLNNLKSYINILQNYEEPINPKMYKISNDLSTMSNIKKGSKIFCELELKALIRSTKNIQKTLATNR